MISVENEVKMLTIHYLKTCTQSEWNVFKKHLQKEENRHCIETNGIIFCQLINNGSSLSNKHKYQVFQHAVHRQEIQMQ